MNRHAYSDQWFPFDAGLTLRVGAPASRRLARERLALGGGGTPPCQPPRRRRSGRLSQNHWVEDRRGYSSLMQRILLALCLTLVSPTAFAQAYVAALTVTVPGQTPLAGWAAWIDMSSGIFQPVVTRSACAACTNAFPAVQLLDTKSFATQNHTLVAVTANAGLGLGQYVNGTCQSWTS